MPGATLEARNTFYAPHMVIGLRSHEGIISWRVVRKNIPDRTVNTSATQNCELVRVGVGRGDNAAIVADISKWPNMNQQPIFFFTKCLNFRCISLYRLKIIQCSYLSGQSTSISRQGLPWTAVGLAPSMISCSHGKC